MYAIEGAGRGSYGMFIGIFGQSGFIFFVY